MADAVTILGKVDTERPLGRRDAFHVPGILAFSSFTLQPGQRVRFLDDVGERVAPVTKAPQGIVDPFLMEPVPPGQNCWVLLMPGLVHGLVHHFHIDGLSEAGDARLRASIREEVKLEVNAEYRDRLRKLTDQEEEDSYDECRGCH